VGSTTLPVVKGDAALAETRLAQQPLANDAVGRDRDLDT
jgi:hypothetical protein